LAGSGKTTLAEGLKHRVDGYHITFPRKLGKTERGTVLKTLKRFMRYGTKRVKREAVKNSYKEFVESGKTSLNLDGIISPFEINELKRISPELEVYTIFISTPKNRRISFVQARVKDKGGGTRARSRVWLTVLDLFHKKTVWSRLKKLKKTKQNFIGKYWVKIRFNL